MFRTVAVLSLGVAIAACGDDKETTGTGQKLIDKWKGATPHLEASGTINGVEFEISMTGDAASNLSFLPATPKWCVGDAATCEGGGCTEGLARNLEINIRDRNANTFVGDAFGAAYDKFQLSFDGMTLDEDVVGTVAKIVADSQAPGTNEIHFGLDIRDRDAACDTYTDETTCAADTQCAWDTAECVHNEADDFFSAEAESGEFVLAAWSGHPEDGEDVTTAPTGVIGGVVSARFSLTDEITVSFSAMTDENKFKDPAEGDEECTCTDIPDGNGC